MAATIVRRTARLTIGLPHLSKHVANMTMLNHCNVQSRRTRLQNTSHRLFSRYNRMLTERKFTESHEWIILEESPDVARVGVSDHAQDQLGDMVYVELPEVGIQVSKGDDMLVLESVKAASDVYAPADGEVVAVNENLEDSPELVNSSPYNDGWLVQLKLSDPSSLDTLMTEDQYKDFISQQE